MTPTLGAIYHTMSPFIWRISGDFGIRWYGFAYILAFAASYFILVRLARAGRSVLPEARVLDCLLTLVMGVLIGGRLGYCVFYEPSILTSFNGDFPYWGLFRLTQGGMSFHGGLLGVMFATWYICKIQKSPEGLPTSRMSPLALFDSLALCTPIGLFLGRIANFINGELLGKIVAPPGEPAPWWAVKFPHELTSGQELSLTETQTAQLRALVESQTIATDTTINMAADRLLHRVLAGDTALAAKLEPFISARHPSQIYEAIGEGLLVGIIVWIIFLFRPRPGVVGCVFMMSYALTRFASEFWRLPDSQLVNQHIMGLSRGQLFSSFMFLLGAVVLAFQFKKPATAAGVIPSMTKLP